MSIWLTMVIAGLLTFATRLSFIFLLEKFDVPVWFKKALRFVPVAVLSAITLPQLVAPDGALKIGLDNAQLLSGIIAVLVAWRTKNIVLTILLGLAALVIVQAVVGRV